MLDKPENLYIIDGHAHIYAAYYAPMSQQLTSPAGEPTKATYIFTMTMLGLLKNNRPDMLIVAMDSKAKTFRSDIYPDYKAHRPPMPDDLPPQIDRIEQILKALRIPIFRLDGFEADDIIGTIAKKASADNINVYICTKDKDILQLLDQNVCMYDIKNGIRTGPEEMKIQKGVSPDQFIDVLALQGDTADNVPGVPDVGPKTAITWIQQYGSLDNLYEHAEEIKGKRGENLRASKEQAYLSKKLVTIDCDVPVNIDYEKFKLSDPDPEKVTTLFTELGFSRLLTQLGLSSPKIDDSAEAPQQQTTADAIDGLASAKTVKHDYKLIDTPEKFDAFLAELKKQTLFAVDTETNSINPMWADLVGICISWHPHTGYYLPIKSPLGVPKLDLGKIRPHLAPIFADQKIKKIGQNIKFDMLVLHNAKLPLKGVAFDTMIASYCLDAARRSHSMDNMALDYLNYECVPISALIGKGKNQLTFDMVDTVAACEYAAEDADITLQLYQYLAKRLDAKPDIKKLFDELEMPLIHVLAAIEANGVSLDVPLLKGMSIQIADSICELADRIYDLAGLHFNLDSPKQLADILFNKLGLQPVRIGKTGQSTDAGVLEKLAEQHPIAELLLEYRTLSKLQNTYVDKLGSLINRRTGRVHASFNQSITSTGRLSSSSPNLQNIPIRTDLGAKIRSAFIPAKKTDCILSADYSQIELRLLAHFSKDKAMLEAFTEDRDIHSFVASQIYNCSLDQVTSEMRSKCKAVNFGIIYGQGAFGLSRSIGISQTEAKKFIEDYFARYSSIRDFMDSVVAQAQKTGYAETILHRRRNIANLSAKGVAKRNQAARMAVNTVIQGSAADLIKVAMISIQRKIDAENLPVKMILQVHDELVFELPEKDAKCHAGWIAEEMTTAISLDVPLKVDISNGPNWLSK